MLIYVIPTRRGNAREQTPILAEFGPITYILLPKTYKNCSQLTIKRGFEIRNLTGRGFIATMCKDYINGSDI